MILKDLARAVVDGPVALARLRATNRKAMVNNGVKFAGSPSRVKLGNQVAIFGPTVLAVTDGGGLDGSRLEVGERTYIGEFNNIRTAGAPIIIGSDCLISQHITIVGSNHATALGSPITSQPWEGDGVLIGDDVWIGAGAVILPGARIGDGAVVAANAVVRGEVPANAIVGGVPARVLGHRHPASQ
ncbi:acyltransferase [Luteococcus sp. OSA5]|uniref:acyltransferase n=1 Tax=Luteococcus sp. OSA5 TaxID=3401630 RepID=UPI003B429F09